MSEEEFHELQSQDEFHKIPCMKILKKNNFYTETYIGE